MNGKSVAIGKNKFAIVCLILGLTLTFASALSVSNKNKQYILDAAHEAADKRMESTLTRIQLYEYGLAGARGSLIVVGKEAMTRNAFKMYSQTRNVDKEFPGARGFGYIERVLPKDELRFVDESRLDGWPDFTVRELNDNSDERFVIKYIEPVVRNMSAIGLDIASEKHRKEAALSAAISGKVQISAPITLVQATGKPQQSFLILMPLYEGGVTPDSVEERKEKSYGWSYAPLIMEEVLADQTINQEFEHFSLSDVTIPNSPYVFYDSDLNGGEQNFVSVIKKKNEVFGRIWESEYAIKPAFVDAMHLSSPNLVAFVGLLLSFLISALVGAMNQTRQNRNLVIQEQTKLASIIESTLDAVIGQSLDGYVTSWNRGARELFGYKRDEVIGKKLMDLIVTPLDKKDELDNIQKVSQGSSITHFDAIRQRKDGSLVDVSIAVSPITNENAKVIGSSVSCRDITDQKQNEQMILDINNNLEQQVEQRTSELAAASNHLLMAAEVAELGIWTWEIVSNKITWNNKMYEIYGYDVCELPENLNYDHWYSRLHPEDSVEAETALQEAVSGHGVFNPVFRIIQPNGEVHHIQAGAYIERSKDGSAIKVTGINRDITSQVELETWLRHAKKQSDDASKAKSNFLANMSHEIRTPMNAVLGMLNLIQRTELTRRQKDYAIKATSAASSLLSLLNDILDYSKIDAGKLELETHSFELESVMEELSTILSGNQSDKAVEILFDLSIDIPATLIGDQLRLQQVLINLTSNAFKFTEEGNIVLKVEELLRTNNTTTLQFSVTDTGIGIHPEQMDKIFHGFSQAEASIARKFGGSGLGLVISKTLIELMGGELKVESEIGKGSTFSFSITYQCDNYSVYEKHKAYLVDHQLDILIVDDSQVALDVMANMARNLGWNADVASNGVQALDLIRKLSDEKRAYDVILLDWQMPNMSGIDMLEVLMKTEGEAFTSKVILITAFAQGALSEIKNLNKLPIADVISKPSTPIQLLNLVHSVLNDQTLSPDSIVIPFQEESKLDEINVLLVEDNALNRQVATELLVMEGANVDIAEGGIEGVAKATAEGSSYDVVLMDMQMPDIDGLEATRRIRENSRLINLPILAMTANVSSVDIKACLDAGMNDHLGKPIEIQFVVERILFWTQDKASDTVHSFIAKDIDDGDIKTESLQTLLQRFSGNKVLFKKVMATFEGDSESLFQQLRDANNSNNKEQISAVLHTFRGAASTIGAISVVEKLKYLELSMMKTNENNICPFEGSELDDLEVMIQLSLIKLNSFNQVN